MKAVKNFLVVSVVLTMLSCTVFVNAATGKDDSIIPASDVFDESYFYVEDFTVEKDQTVTVPLLLKNNVDIKNVTVEITVGSNINIQDISFTDGVLGTGSFGENIITWSLSSESNAQGKVADITFAGNVVGKTEIQIAVLSVTDGNGIEIDMFDDFLTAVRVTSGDVIYGDANDDGEVDSKDLVRLKKKLAGQSVEINEGNADCNGDDAVDTKDLVRLKKYLAGQSVILGPGE